MEAPFREIFTTTDGITEGAQHNTHPDMSATIVSLVDNQNVSIISVTIVPAPQALFITTTPIVATIVQNKNEDTGAVSSSGNARVLVRRRGQAKMIIQGTRVSGSFDEFIVKLV